MGYTAGTLDLSIIGASDKAVASIDKTVKSLNSLSRSIQIIDKTDINVTFDKLAQSINYFSESSKNIDVSAFEKLEAIGRTGKGLTSLADGITKLNSSSTILATHQLSNFFEKVSSASQKIDTAAISSLSSLGKSLTSISNISKINNIDWAKAEQGFQNLAVSITPFIAKIKEAEASLTALYGILNKSSGKKIGNLLNGNNQKSNNSFDLGSLLTGKFSWKSIAFNSIKSFISGLLRVASWSAVLYYARRLGGYIADIAIKGGSFGETLNLWTVAIGDELLPQAEKFVNKLNEAYGISKQTLMNSQAIFKNMLGSLGEISSETAYRLSEGVTQMALDYASLYNVTFESAMTKFQAALAGQVRPIRSVSGYDITENTLFQLYQELGGTKTMRQLSRTEKQLLAIYAVFQQLERSGARGDLARTINSFANQSRITADSWKAVQTYAGLIVTRLLEQYNVMQYVNAVLIFMSRLLEGLANALDTGLGNSGDVFGDMENSVLGANEAVEELQNSLLDFDKFRALDQTSSIENSLGIDQTIVNAMSRYDTILKNAQLKSRELADAWLQALGFIDKAKDGIIDIEGGVSGIVTKITNIDWGNVASNLSKAIINGLGAFEKWLESINWKKLGEDVALWINATDWDNLLLATGNLAGAIGNAVTTAIYNGILNIDWIDLAVQLIEGIFFGIAQMFEDFYVALGLPAEGITQSLMKGWELVQKVANDIVNGKGGKYFGFANGGLPDKGTMFVAGEAGAEMVYNMPSGQSGVANIQQIAQATYSGTMRALNDWWGGSQAKGDIPQLKEANATGMYQAVTGVANSQGKVWATV